MRLARLIIVCAVFTPLHAQKRVDPRNSYSRVICVVPFTGSGTSVDPKRPLHIPAPAQKPAATNRSGIIAWTSLASDDGKFAIVEYVAQTRAGLAPILTDPAVLLKFETGAPPATKAQIETALKTYRSTFSLDQFGVRVP